ncbi:MAG TPA: EamA family transporter [Armatimonadota bacterium]|nr:EamA family transporter [Armatimonadota bacterium]
MGKGSFVPIVLILVNVVLGSIGQVSLRYGASLLGDLRAGQGIAASVLCAFKGIFTLYIFLGFSLYAISSVLWVLVLNQVSLSFAYPMISLSYVLVVLLSAVILGERVPLVSVGGLVLICVGVSLIGIGYGAGK